MEDQGMEKEHLLSDDSSQTFHCDGSDTNSTKETVADCKNLSKLPLFFKSMENFSNSLNDENKALLLSKSSNHISDIQQEDITFYDDIKQEVSSVIQRPEQLSLEPISSYQKKEKGDSFDDSSCSDGTPVVHLQHKNGQVFPAEPSSTDNLARIFRYVHSPSRYETSQSSDSIICRICHSCDGEKLIAPCKCAGSTRYVHATCLVTWFKKSVKHQCELCRSDVKVRKINHKIGLWRKPEDRPVPLIWFTVFFVGLFLNILSIYVNASEYCKSTACLIFYIVNGFGIILDAAFLWFWFLKCRHYWKKWCALNQDWFIDENSDDKAEEMTSVQFVQGGCPV